MNKEKRIVIVGGGIAGPQLAYKLQEKGDLTLIDPKEFFEVPMAAPREMLHPEFSDQAVIPYADFLTKGRHLLGKAISVSPSTVRVESEDANTSQEVAYDVLVLATGSSYRSGLVKAHSGTTEHRRQHYETLKNQIDSAKRILIAGGGPVGVEIAAEILEVHPDKALTIVHAGNRLLEASSETSGKKARNYLTSRGVDVVFGDKIVDSRENDVVVGPATATTASGQRIEFGLLLWCIGAKHGTSYMREYLPETLDENGRIKVESSLLVAGQSNIFALGDVTALPETKLAAWTTMHVPVVRKNIEILLDDPDHDRQKLKKYKPKTGNELMLVALGPKNGVGAMPWGQFLGDFLAKKLKSPKMLVPMYRKKVGQLKNSHAH